MDVAQRAAYAMLSAPVPCAPRRQAMVRCRQTGARGRRESAGRKRRYTRADSMPYDTSRAGAAPYVAYKACPRSSASPNHSERYV